jgi:hypothetical protein
MIAHLFIHNGRLTWSGYGASGDPAHTHALVVDVGRDFIITSDGLLYLIGPGPFQFEEFSADGFAVAARLGRLGFRVLRENESASWRRDRRDRARRKLGRRGRIAKDQLLRESGS